MAPGELSPKFKRAIRIERQRDYLLHHSESAAVATHDVLESFLRKIGQCLSNAEKVMLDGIMARTELRASSDKVAQKNFNVIVREAGRIGVNLHEVSFMVDPETFYLYDEDGLCVDRPSENEPGHPRRQLMPGQAIEAA